MKKTALKQGVRAGWREVGLEQGKVGMNTRVRYVSPLIFEVAGKREEDVSLSNGERTVSGLIDALGKRHGRELTAAIIDGQGNLHPHIHVVINGKDILHIQGLDTPVEDGDVVAFIMPMSGG